jgi:hypothetical protein
MLLGFEVMDKEWPLLRVLIGFLGLGLLGLIVAGSGPSGRLYFYR